MSFLDFIEPKNPELENHHPITRMLEDNTTWQRWSIGCICGFYDKGTPGKWFIPSEGAAMQLYKAHLIQAGIEEEKPEKDDEEPVDVVEWFDLIGVFA